MALLPFAVKLVAIREARNGGQGLQEYRSALENDDMAPECPAFSSAPWRPSSKSMSSLAASWGGRLDLEHH